MKELDLTALSAFRADLVTDSVPSLHDDATLLAMPLTAAKHLATSAFERRYLVHVMERAAGSVSEGARIAGLDRANFRRLLQRHGLR